MVSAVGSQNKHVHVNRPAGTEAASPGKSAESVGHRAKAEVAESGDTAPNAIGRAASRIARMDFSVLVPPPPAEETPVEETPIEETPVEEAPVGETPVEEAPVGETPIEETPIVETPVGEEPVLDLEPETPADDGILTLLEPFLPADPQLEPETT